MPLGEKLFEETGKVMGMNVKPVHSVEGTTIEMSFASEIKGVGNFPTGRNLGSGTVTQYPHGIVDAAFQGQVTTAEGEQYLWWEHEKSRVLEGGEFKGIIIVTGYTNSQKLSWMNELVIAIDVEFDPDSQEFKGTGYEWET